jgi:uncharacterized protein YegJ (DUF2314 family)
MSNWENDENVRPVCDDCIQESRQRFQEEEHIIEPNDFIKTTFRDGTFKESMWVKVTEVNEETIIGTLYNHPHFIEGLDFGDAVVVKRDEVWNHLKDPDR